MLDDLASWARSDVEAGKASGSSAGRGGAADRLGRSLSIKELSKIYATRDGVVEAVRKASFDVKAGEFVSLIGPSGCGKSTILQICAGLVSHDRGSVEVGGTEAAPGRREVGIMFQSAVLLPWRSVIDNVLLPTELFRIDKKESLEKARRLLELVGLQGFEKKYPWELSGGMQQRCSLARLLVYEPDILLMDEPFGALDEFTRERLNLELAGLHESLDRTVLYVTHNIQEAVFLSDRVVVMKPHPGEILDIVEIPLRRPRTFDLLAERQTVELAIKIRRMLFESGDDTSGRDE